MQLQVGQCALPAAGDHVPAPRLRPGASAAQKSDASAAHEPTSHTQAVQALPQALPKTRQQELQATSGNCEREGILLVLKLQSIYRYYEVKNKSDLLTPR